MTKHLTEESLYDVLRQHFHQLSLDAIQDLVHDGELIYVDSEVELIKQGDDTKDVYFLLFGRIIASIENRFGEKVLLNEIPQGELFGEMSLLSEEPRAATLTTTKESTLLRISGDAFEKLLDRHPSILKYINKILIGRLKKSNLSNSDITFQNICCIQLGESDIAIQSLDLLQEKFDKIPKTYIITKESVLHNYVFSNDDDRSSKRYKFINWVHKISNQYDFILYICDQRDLEWSELCVREADRILLFREKNTSTALTQLEDTIFIKKGIAGKIEKNLVINWMENDTISKTPTMLSNRNIKNIFHITSKKDIDRLIRYIRGRSVKLVLSGGGAKGFAHLGVYKAMTELNIPIDFVGGTSAGSLMAAAMASGWSYALAKENSYQALVKNNPLNDYQLPFVSFLKGKRLGYTLNKYFGNTQIEDLKYPFYAVASNFTKSRIEILNHGSLAFAIGASMAIPAMLPPSVRGDSLLVDGGLMDNLPYDHMSTLALGPTIGVDLSSSKTRSLLYEEVPNNFTLLKQKLFGKEKHKVPNVSQIMMGTMTLASQEKIQNNEKKFDVYIKPDVSGFSFLKWDNFEALIQCGYDAAYPILKKWTEKSINM